MRRLIVNADDLGRTPQINAGIFRCAEIGIVTSASLMVYWPAAREAADYARQHPRLGIGLHLDFAEWRQQNGDWSPRYERVDLDDPDAVRRELDHQWNVFADLMGRTPTHLDSHQHLHLRDAVRPLVAGFARERGIPLRSDSSTIRYCGDFYGQNEFGQPDYDAISAETLVRILEQMPAGTTELCCHPGDLSDFDNEYNIERTREVEALCDPRVRVAVERCGIELCSFGDVSPMHKAGTEGGLRS